VASMRAFALAQGVITTMTLSKLKLVGIVVLALGSACWGAGSLVYRALANERPASAAQAPEPARPGAAAPVIQESPKPPTPQEPARNTVEVPSQRDGVLAVAGKWVKTGTGAEAKYARWKVGDKVEERELLARLDDRLARDDVAIAQAKVNA